MGLRFSSHEVRVFGFLRKLVDTSAVRNRVNPYANIDIEKLSESRVSPHGEARCFYFTLSHERQNEF